MALLDKLFTVKEACSLLELSDSRIRQICIEHNLGTKAGSVRFLTADDINRIRDGEFNKPMGRPKKS